MTRLRGGRGLPLSWKAKKKKKRRKKINGEFNAGWWTSLLKVSASEGCYTARQNDSFFPCTALNRTLWNTSSDKGGKRRWSRAPSEEPIQHFPSSQRLLTVRPCVLWNVCIERLVVYPHDKHPPLSVSGSWKSIHWWHLSQRGHQCGTNKHTQALARATQARTLSAYNTVELQRQGQSSKAYCDKHASH